VPAGVMAAVRERGIEAWDQPLNDITSPAGKNAGGAQARRGKAVLHHVTMAYDIDAGKMLQVLRIGREKLSDKGTTSAGKRVDPLRSQTGLPRAEVIAHMVETFGRRHGGLKIGTLHPDELGRAQVLARDRFATPEWTALLP